MPPAPPTLAEWLRARPFALAMSSGFFAFFAHAGVLSALVSEGHVPVRVSGSSAGALVTGAWASGVAPETIARELLSLERSDFWDPAPGLGVLRGELFRRKLATLLPVPTFEACAIPAAISVFDGRTRRTRVVEHGPLSTAIRASCAVPGLFHPVRVEGRLSWDGGIGDRAGLAGMPAGARVLHHPIASRSPWRGLLPSSRDASAFPLRRDMTTLLLDGLPRSGPFRLDAGRRAYDQARMLTHIALGRRVEDAQVRLHA